MDYAILMTIALVLGGGVSGGLLTTWSLHRRAFRLEVRMNAVEETVTHQAKTHAAKVRWAKKESEDAVLARELTAARSNTANSDPWLFPGG